MATEEIHKEDIGTRLLITLKDDGSAVDISTSTTKEFTFTKPDNTQIVRVATFNTDGTDGKVYYDFQSGELDVVGPWRYQIKIVMTGTWRSNIETFKVFDNL